MINYYNNKCLNLNSISYEYPYYIIDNLIFSLLNV